MPMRCEELAARPIAHLALRAEKPRTDDFRFLPGGRTKKGKALRVPVSALARLIILESIVHEDRSEDGSEFAFTTTAETSVSDYAKAKRRLDRNIDDVRRARDAMAARVPAGVLRAVGSLESVSRSIDLIDHLPLVL